MFRSLVSLMALTLLASTAVAADVYGDWRLDDGNNTVEAFTRNSSGSLTGQICWKDSGKCIFYLMPDGITCAEGSTQILLMSTDLGGYSVTTTCTVLGDKHLFFFSDYDVLRKNYRESSNVGFAIALESGNFKAIRFSLNGSRNALIKAEDIAAKAYEKKQHNVDLVF